MNYVSQATVLDVIEHQVDLREYIIKLDQQRKYSPGSFVQLTLDMAHASSIWPESRTFSIASYQSDSMHFIIKNVGSYTSRIFSELNSGSRCTIKYPFGNLFDKKTIGEKHVMVAGGIGITPFFGMIDYFEQNDCLERLELIYSAKYKEDLLYWEKLQDQLKDHLHIHLTQESAANCIYRRIDINDILAVAGANDHVYICGSSEFNQTFKEQLNRKGFMNIHTDEWE